MEIHWKVFGPATMVVDVQGPSKYSLIWLKGVGGWNSSCASPEGRTSHWSYPWLACSRGDIKPIPLCKFGMGFGWVSHCWVKFCRSWIDTGWAVEVVTLRSSSISRTTCLCLSWRSEKHQCLRRILVPMMNSWTTDFMLFDLTSLSAPLFIGSNLFQSFRLQGAMTPWFR